MVLLLQALLVARPASLRLNDWIDDLEGTTVFEHACKLDHGGIVSNRRTNFPHFDTKMMRGSPGARPTAIYDACANAVRCARCCWRRADGSP